MFSVSLNKWQTTRKAALDDIETLHKKLGGTGPGRRYATEQLNRAYVIQLSSEFQAFCRDLHSEAIQHLMAAMAVAAPIKMIVNAQFTFGRKLDSGNPNPSNLGSDFNRLGLTFIDEVKNADPRNKTRLKVLEELNTWRNAIAHNDYQGHGLPRTFPLLKTVQRWRSVCNALAKHFDEIIRAQLASLLGASPW